MTYQDRYANPLSTSSSLAAARYLHGVDLLASMWPGADRALDEAITADPDFALALAARARLHVIVAQPAKARELIASALAAVQRSGTDRERSHVNVIALAVGGQAAHAQHEALRHVDRWPTDALILSMLLGAFGMLAFSGMADHDQARVDLCDRLAVHYDDDDWWFLTSRGWAHGENGNHAFGRTLTERALMLRPQNANAAHSLAHCLYEAGASEEAQAMIDEWLPRYDASGVLHGHLAWHRALLSLEQGDAESALQIYLASVAPSVSQGAPINVISDTASFLWRMQAYGHTVSATLWTEAVDYSRDHYQRAGFAFIDVHMAMLSAATAGQDAVDRRVGELQRLVVDGTLPAGTVVPAICQALAAFAEHDYVRCSEILAPVAAEVVRIGGSAAQREVIEDTLLIAWMKADALANAHALLSQRLARRPSVRDSGWLQAITVS